jgi:hypothetical protein
VGLNDAVTKRQEHPTKMYVDVMKNVCQSYHVPFSFIVSDGGYFHENGDYTQEKTLVLCLLDPEKGVVDGIARDLCAFLLRCCSAASRMEPRHRIMAPGTA